MLYVPLNHDLEPQVNLTQWSIRKVVSSEYPDLGETIHFVGRLSWGRDGRVSSEIMEFDPLLMRGVTASGRVYELEGPSGRSMDADYVWGAWCSMNKVIEWKDVTEEIVNAK